MSGRVVQILYHGTPHDQSGYDILNYGFVIGQGDTFGSGLYLGDLQTAKSYTRGTGIIIKVKIDVPEHQVIDNSELIASPGFTQWTLNQVGVSLGDNITTYTIQVLNKRFIRVNPSYYVALAHKTALNERVFFEGLTILGVLDAIGNPI